MLGSVRPVRPGWATLIWVDYPGETLWRAVLALVAAVPSDLSEVETSIHAEFVSEHVHGVERQVPLASFDSRLPLLAPQVRVGPSLTLHSFDILTATYSRAQVRPDREFISGCVA